MGSQGKELNKTYTFREFIKGMHHDNISFISTQHGYESPCHGCSLKPHLCGYNLSLHVGHMNHRTQGRAPNVVTTSCLFG